MRRRGILAVTLLISIAALGMSVATAHAEGNVHKVNHVIIIMQENHSFDNYFGALPYAPGSPYHGGACKNSDHGCVDGLTCSFDTMGHLNCSNSNLDDMAAPSRRSMIQTTVRALTWITAGAPAITRPTFRTRPMLSCRRSTMGLCSSTTRPSSLIRVSQMQTTRWATTIRTICRSIISWRRPSRSTIAISAQSSARPSRIVRTKWRQLHSATPRPARFSRRASTPPTPSSSTTVTATSRSPDRSSICSTRRESPG